MFIYQYDNSPLPEIVNYDEVPLEGFITGARRGSPTLIEKVLYKFKKRYVITYLGVPEGGQSQLEIYDADTKELLVTLDATNKYAFSPVPARVNYDFIYRYKNIATHPDVLAYKRYKKIMQLSGKGLKKSKFYQDYLKQEGK